MGCGISISSFAPPPFEDNQASSLVQQGWGTAHAYASEAFNTATGFIGQLVDISGQITAIPDISVDVGSPDSIISGIVLPAAPSAPTGLELNLPLAPVEPVLGDVSPLVLPDAPSFVADLPAINLDIQAPAPLAASVPAEPSLIAVPIPVEPDIVLPDVPTLTNLSIPAAPVLDIPIFSAVLADAPMTAPDTTFAFTEPGYASSLLDAIKAKLLEWVNGASTGIAPAVEQALWDRARAREDVNSLRGIDEVSRTFASRGFSIPPGAMLKATLAAVQDAVDKASSLSRDEAIKQADLEQSNRRFAFEQGWQVESGLITYSNQVAQRAFDVARFTLQAAIDVFNATINRYNAQVQAYGVEAEVFKARIQGALANLEVFKAQLEAQRLVGEINVQQVEIYKSRIQAANALIDLYNGKVNAANALAGINKTLIEGFASRVQAYDSQVKAKASEYDAYATEVRAEVSKAEVFKTQADAYRSQVEGYGALVNAKVQQSQSEIKINQEVPLDLFRERVGVFGELVKAESARVSALADVYRSDGSVYQATASAQAAKVGAEADAYKAETSLLLGKSNLVLESAKANLERMLKSLDMLMESVKSGAQVSAQLAASSLSSVNLSGSISDGQSNNKSMSVGYSMSDSASRSNSCSEIYTHSE